jgi:hypothetical protein
MTTTSLCLPRRQTAALNAREIDVGQRRRFHGVVLVSARHAKQSLTGIFAERACAAMSTEIENLSTSFALVKREVPDAHAVLSRLDHQTRKLFAPSARPRPGGAVCCRPTDCAASADRLPTWRGNISATTAIWRA